MIEKVNPSHPDKLADRISGALVDLAYKKNNNPKIAVEILLGHGNCHIIIETSEEFNLQEVSDIVNRIVGPVEIDLQIVRQDPELSKNQIGKIRCGDNGIFKGVPLREIDKKLSKIARDIYNKYPYDGKYVLDNDKLIICQSHAKTSELNKDYPNAIINPLGDWIGGIDSDSGATNRKLGSDMALSVSGGGIHGKDLSKSDVSVNIYAFLKAQELGKEINYSCAIGDEYIDGVPYEEIVKTAEEYVNNIGGFEKLAEWGLY